MADQLRQHPTRKEFCYKNVEISRNKSLGSGSYGAVCRAQCDDLPCAAKILHPAFFQSSDPGAATTMQRFQQECEFLSAIRHPHIVQYLGTYQDPESGLPVLLMELMDESLTKFLERSPEPLPYHLEVNLCHDVALALSFLHSNGIIHRDLSSNNVLLIAGSRAKVSDFGMSKLNSCMTPLTHCPGTLFYMAPEALRDPPSYTERLDCLSFGVLSIQILTRLFPSPGPSEQAIEDSRYPIGHIRVPIPDVERRKSHIELIDPNHPLLAIAVSCLSYSDKERPTAHNLCQDLATLKEAPQYINTPWQQGESLVQTMAEAGSNLQEQCTAIVGDVHQHGQHIVEERITTDAIRSDKGVQTDDTTYQELEEKLGSAHQQLESVKLEAQKQKEETESLQREDIQEIESLKKKLFSQEQLLQEKSAKISAQQKRVVQLCTELEQLWQQVCLLPKREQSSMTGQLDTQELPNSQLQEKSNNQMVEDLQQALCTKDKVIANLKTSLEVAKKRIEELAKPQMPVQIQRGMAAMNRDYWSLKWRACADTEKVMSRGASAVKQNKVYVRPGDSAVVYEYSSDESLWTSLPECPQELFNLAVINNLVTAVGGLKSGFPTGDLVTLTKEAGEAWQWSKLFPAMPTGRMLAAVVSTPQCLVAAGGRIAMGVGAKLSTVEILDYKTFQWQNAPGLPHPVSAMSATLCDGNIYLMGGYAEDGKTQSVYTCPLTSLYLKSRSMRERLKALASSNANPWRCIAYVPVYRSTCVALSGHLLAIGGCDSKGTQVNTGHVYDNVSDSWHAVTHMICPREDCMAEILAGNRLMVVGGRNNKSVEIANIVYRSS